MKLLETTSATAAYQSHASTSAQILQIYSSLLQIQSSLLQIHSSLLQIHSSIVN